MANKKILFVIPVIVLVFGMIAAGCDNGTNGNDTWSNLTSLDQLNGTWKGSNSVTMTYKEHMHYNDEYWESNGLGVIYGNDLKVTQFIEMTITFYTSTKTVTQNIKQILTYTGNKIATVWTNIKDEYEGETGISINDIDYSVSAVIDLDQILTESDIDNLLTKWQISQSGNKLKPPSNDFLVEILTKQ